MKREGKKKRALQMQQNDDAYDKGKQLKKHNRAEQSRAEQKEANAKYSAKGFGTQKANAKC